MAAGTSYPREIEEIPYEQRAVRAPAVVGIPHLELGLDVGAAVAPKASAAATEDEVRDPFEADVAAYSYPQGTCGSSMSLSEEPTGKILKRKLELAHAARRTTVEQAVNGHAHEHDERRHPYRRSVQAGARRPAPRSR